MLCAKGCNTVLFGLIIQTLNVNERSHHLEIDNLTHEL